MQIGFTPQRRDDALVLHRAGDVLTVNATAFDFGPLPEGAVLPRAAVGCPWLVSDVTRQGGRVRLTLILPHGPGVPLGWAPPPADDPPDGPVALPAPEEDAR